MKYVDEFMSKFRVDGRLEYETRLIDVQLYNDTETGYAEIRQGRTHVRTQLDSTTERSKFKMNLKYLQADSVTERQKYQIKSKIEKIFSDIMRSSGTSVTVLVVEDNGGLIAAIINCITLCLTHCSVPIADMAIAVSYNTGIDLCKKEENGPFIALLVYLSNTKKVIYFDAAGSFTRTSFIECTEAAKLACQNIASQFKTTLLTSNDSR
ncbi:component of the 3 5 exoribonuclease for 3 processing of 5.8S rRNA [Enterospora canceri]|uniref:Component of the 3 5 exoribonuclease for 3 processing of 5.8S rRNA n=1 Tax=Enterospora canceri TaxID=1081671 RepID=A0A1Y1SAQ3_9MICR|nr:component of the 3 5 exoribonuclease for 3 processing of 5.8S rRNA [Enterospora canceri]